jgi:uncharacterized surface protein with fasciclin (FAS1) repeats
MKTLFYWLLAITLIACGESTTETSSTTSTEPGPGQSAVQDEVSEPNVVQVAVGSAAHTTLVAAVKAGDLVDALSNAGPFTVFAPTNAAFDALPAGTVENLLKPENKDQLINILEYHVYVGVIRENMIRDGMTLNQVNGKNITLGYQDGKITVNGVSVLGAVNASNGIVYVIDQVLLPQ